MNSILPFVISGVVSGAIYGLAGSGLTLTFKTSGIFNFAHGALAAVSAYFYYFLTVTARLPWEPAVAISVLGVGVAGGILLEYISRAIRGRAVVYRVVGTIGLILVVQGLISVIYGPDSLPLNQFLPAGNNTFELFGAFVTYAQATIVVLTVVLVIGLYAFFRVSRTGLAMQAVVDDPDLVNLQGMNANKLRRVAWIIGATFVSLSGVLLAPIVGLNVTTLTFLVVPAFGAAAAGSFTNIPITFMAGIGIGVASDVSQKYVSHVSWLSGLPASLPFIILFVVLLALPKRRLIALAGTEPPLRPEWRGPIRLVPVGAVVVLGLLALLPFLDPIHLPFYTTGLATALILLSLGLLVRTSGQISLAAASFAAIGAVAFSQFQQNFHLPWLIAVLLGALVVVPVGALIAIPAIRLSGLFLALATFAFGLMVTQFFFPLNIGFTTLAQGRPMPRPSGFATDRSYYFIVLAFVAVIGALIIVINRTRFGRLLRGLAESATAVRMMGLRTEVTRVSVFCISTFIAALAGILYGCSVNFASSVDPYFSPTQSLVFLAMLAIAPFGPPWYAVFAVVSALVEAYFANANTTYWLNTLFGVFAVITAMQGGTPEMPLRLRSWLTQLGGGKAARRQREVQSIGSPELAESTAGRTAGRRATAGQASATGGRQGLELSDLTVRFGGLTAVSDLSLHAPLGRITGLIGPNGAGKTTTFDACCGLNKPTSGSVRLHGWDASRANTALRARHGLGRSFQTAQLCDSLTVLENVAMGREAGFAGAGVISQFAGARTERQEITEASYDAMELCGIANLAHVPVGALPGGQRRLVEVARCLAGPFDMLLLDEPSAGLDTEESRVFGAILLNVLDERDCGMLLVEHDMSLVLKVCSYIYVLDFGKLLFEGTPDELAASEVVRNAYLGNDDPEHMAI